MADPRAPDLFQRLLTFMREADEWGTPADVLRSAEDAGLAIVSEADRRVLEACAAIDEPLNPTYRELERVYETELARRKP